MPISKHITKVTKTNVKHAHSLAGPKANGHVTKRLKKLDKHIKSKHPNLNVSLEKKYKTVVRIARV